MLMSMICAPRWYLINAASAIMAASVNDLHIGVFALVIGAA
jgi:hypothetical protein